MRPMFRVSTVNGAFTGPTGRGLECIVIDESGDQGDKAMVTVDDRNEEIALPNVGDIITVEMGYEETGLNLMGEYSIEEIEVGGWPRFVTITATGQNLNTTLKSIRSESYHNAGYPTLGSIIMKVGQRLGLQVNVSPDLANIPNEFTAQSQESDMHFLTRLQHQYDGVAKLSPNQLAFLKRGSGQSGTGQTISMAVAQYPINVIEYDAVLKGFPNYGAGTDATSIKVTNAEEQKENAPKLPTPLPENPAFDQVLGYIPQANLDILRMQASARADFQGRREGTLDILIIGDPTVLAQTILNVLDVHREINGLWSVVKVQHTINTVGYDTFIQAEFPLENMLGYANIYPNSWQAVRGTGVSLAGIGQTATGTISAGGG